MSGVETSTLHAGLGVQLIDDHTGGGPLARVAVALDVLDAGAWRTTSVPPRWSRSDLFTYPWLERRRDARGAPPRRYRVRVAADAYRPTYLFDADGVEVDVYPFDDDEPPAQVPKSPTPIWLLPSAAYPFPATVPLLRGRVVDPAGVPVARARVEATKDRVLTDADGAFVLPLRWARRTAPTSIDATDRQGRHGTVTIQVPDDLGTPQTITIS
jgi:hypothetical protein